jgi:hypothetical protein
MKRIKVMQKNAWFLSRMRFRLELRLLRLKPRPIIVIV